MKLEELASEKASEQRTKEQSVPEYSISTIFRHSPFRQVTSYLVTENHCERGFLNNTRLTFTSSPLPTKLAVFVVVIVIVTLARLCVKYISRGFRIARLPNIGTGRRDSEPRTDTGSQIKSRTGLLYRDR